MDLVVLNKVQNYYIFLFLRERREDKNFCPLGNKEDLQE